MSIQEESAFKSYKNQVHVFFILAIICAVMNVFQSIMFTYTDIMRSKTGELYSGPLYYTGLVLGLTARFVFGMMIICLIWKNKDN